MIDTPLSAALWGGAFGAANGWLSRLALRRALDKADKVFYRTFTAGFFWRLLFLVFSVWFLRDKRYIILIAFVGALLFAQFISEVVPLKKNGTKDNP
jgi:hypothetical protein